MSIEFSLAWYPVKDLEKAKQFYSEVLGLKNTFEMEGWAEFSHTEGGAAVALSQDPRNQGEGRATVVLKVDDLDFARKELRGRGVKFEGRVEEVPGVVRIATFRDPSGNRLQLAQVLVSQ